MYLLFEAPIAELAEACGASIDEAVKERVAAAIEAAPVADICAGSGTTAVAALNTGRRFLCFENAPAFYDPATELQTYC